MLHGATKLILKFDIYKYVNQKLTEILLSNYREGCPNLSFINLAWNNLTMFKLTNQQMLQRVDLTNNALLTVDLSFDTNLQVLKLGGNPMLTNVILTGDNNIQQIHGGWDDFDGINDI